MGKILLIVIIVILFLAGCIVKEVTDKDNIIDKEKDMCEVDSDCWSTDGGCFTYEWFAKKDAEARKMGIYNQRPKSTPEIICTCQNNKCVTHD